MQICQYNPSIFVEWCNTKNQELNLRVKTTYKFIVKDILLHFLLELNEDFDDDLLQDALQLLGFD